jgi:hypothetical protein
MKTEEKKIARQFRGEGLSLKEIVKKTGFSKSSVSFWVRDIELTIAQKNELSSKGLKKEIVEKRRKTRIDNENKRRQIIIDAATKEIPNDISQRELWLIGLCLYWGEGAKTLRSGVQFSNSDPLMVKVMMKFFKKICKIPLNKFRGHIHLHPHLNSVSAIKYWHKVSGIPISQFYKTTKQQNRASKNKKDSLPFGTFNIQICNTELFLRIKGWTSGLSKNILLY